MSSRYVAGRWQVGSWQVAAGGWSMPSSWHVVTVMWQIGRALGWWQVGDRKVAGTFHTFMKQSL